MNLGFVQATDTQPGPDLDRRVFETLLRKKVIGSAWCVPIGPVHNTTVYPLTWEVVAGPKEKPQKKVVMRDVFVNVCVCKEPAYGKSPLDAMKVHGHMVMCLQAVPSFSEVDAVALNTIDYYYPEWGCEKKEGEYQITIYRPGSYAEGHTFALAVSRAIVNTRK